MDGPWLALIKLCEKLIDRLEDVSPLVIDYFLGWNPQLADLGRLLIAGALIKRESAGAGGPKHKKDAEAPLGKDRWVRFIIHQLMMPEPGKRFNLADNDVSFLTFNYDRSLENGLHRALSSINSATEESIRRFMAGDRVLHMYGSLEPTNAVLDYAVLGKTIGGHDALATITNANNLINSWEKAAKGLRVIDPVDKHDDAIATEAQSRTGRADVIYFLGFGFDESNLRRIGFPQPAILSGYKHIYFTNFRDSMTVNRRATKAFGVDMREHSTRSATRIHVEKSVRDVDQAIALDFGALAE